MIRKFIPEFGSIYREGSIGKSDVTCSFSFSINERTNDYNTKGTRWSSWSMKNVEPVYYEIDYDERDVLKVGYNYRPI